MRRRGPAAAVILLGFALLAVATVESVKTPVTTLALFAAAAIVAELWQRNDDELAREPVTERAFSLDVPIQLAAAVVLGPWPAALVAAAGVLAVKPFHAPSWERVAVRANILAGSAISAGLAFELARGRTGHLAIPADLVALVALALGYWGARMLLSTITMPWDTVQPETTVAVGETALGVLIALFAIDHPWNLVIVAPILLALGSVSARFVSVRHEVAGALETFANIVDERDPSTYRHSVRVAQHVAELAEALGLPAHDVTRLRWAGRLHDLGKVAVDAAVLRKPGRLDDAEWSAVHRAPRLSARLLQRFRFAAQQAQAVEFHHERFDGTGYYGVGGDDLPLASHFLIVADSFDAMTNDRAFRGRRSAEEALAEIERNSGTQFHPTIAKAFVALRRGVDPVQVLSAEELESVRGASLQHRLPHLPGARDLRERPELVALGGVTIALLGAGTGQLSLLVAGGALAALGIGLRIAGRARAERLAERLRAAAAGEGQEEIFTRVVRRLERACGLTWAALVSWPEHGLGGTIELEYGAPRPSEPALMSWLVREGQAADQPVLAAAFELGRTETVVALPLRRENSALTGFLVLTMPRRPRAHVELAFRSALGSLGLALAEQPAESEAAPEPAPLAALR